MSTGSARDTLVGAGRAQGDQGRTWLHTGAQGALGSAVRAWRAGHALVGLGRAWVHREFIDYAQDVPECACESESRRGCSRGGEARRGWFGGGRDLGSVRGTTTADRGRGGAMGWKKEGEDAIAGGNWGEGVEEAARRFSCTAKGTV